MCVWFFLNLFSILTLYFFFHSYVLITIFFFICKELDRHSLTRLAWAGFNHVLTLTMTSVPCAKARQDNYMKIICSPGSSQLSGEAGENTWLPKTLKLVQPHLRITAAERMFTPHHVSHVKCHTSVIRCQVSQLFFFKEVDLVGGGSVINGAYPN